MQHEYIINGVTFTEEQLRKEAEEKELKRFQAIVGAYLKDNPDDGTDPGKRMLSELMQDQPEEEDTPEEDKPKGLMAKG